MSKKLNLGCGTDIRSDYINMDMVPHHGVDFVCDVNCGLPFKDNHFKEIMCNDFVEHIPQDNVIFLMNELWRVLENSGILKIHVPEAPGVTSYQDPTHVSYWNEESFTYYLADHGRRENYGKHYGIKAKFNLVSLKRKKHLAEKYEKLNMPNYLLDVELSAVKNDS